MNDFILRSAEQTGLSPADTRSATAALLGLIRRRIGVGEFARLLVRLPGAAEVVQEAPKPAGPRLDPPGALPGDPIARALHRAGSFLSGNEASSVGVGQVMHIPREKVTPFVSMFLQHVESQAGKDLAKKLLVDVPELREPAR